MPAAPAYSPTETVNAGTHRTYGGQDFVALQNIPTGIPPVPIGDGSTSDRLIVLAGRVGYGAASLGGHNYPTLIVNTTADTGPGSFRQAMIDAQAFGGGFCTWAGPVGTVYNHDFDAVTTLGKVQIPPNVTLCAWGAGAGNVTMSGFGYDDSAGHVSGFYVGGPQASDFTGFYGSVPVHDVIVSGIRFDCNEGFADSHGDVVACRYWARNIVFDHCFFRNFPATLNDGLLDITHTASATVSWCDIYQHHKAVLAHTKPLVGSPTGTQLPPGVTAGSPGPYTIQNVGGVDYIQERVTYVHTIFDSLAQRGPLTDFDTTFAHVSHCWERNFGSWNDGTNPTVFGVYNWPTTNGARYSETTKPGPSVHGPPFIAGPYQRNAGGATKSDGTNVSVVGSSIFSEGCTFDNLAGDSNVPLSGQGGNWKTSGNTYHNCTPPADHLPGNVPAVPYAMATVPAASVPTSLKAGAGAVGGFWAFTGPAVGAPLITGSFAANGQSAGGTFVLPPGAAIGDTAYVAVTLAASSARAAVLPAGWVQQGPELSNGNVCTGQVFSKLIGVGDAGSTVVFTVAASVTWSLAGVTVSPSTLDDGTFVPPATTIYGSSAPGLPEMTPSPQTEMSRTYNNGQISSTPAGMPTCLSMSGSISLSGLANATSKNDAACQAAINYFSPNGNLRDDADHLFCPIHEPDNNSFTDAQITQFAAAMKNFGLFCWPTIKAAYTHKVTWGPIFTGQFYGGGQDNSNPPHTRNDAYRATYLAGYTPDWLGTDPYANLSLIAATATYAAAKGLPWMIGEFGTQANGQGNSTDVQHRDHINSAVADNNALTNPCFAFLYWPSGQNVLWANLASATSAGATSITVTRTSAPGTVVAGQIIIDPHGAHPETVTTIGSFTTTGTGDNNATYQVPALAFPHAANAVVWLMPLAVQAWRAL